MIPQTKDKHVGIEIELISPMNEDQVAEQVSLANLENYISVGSDGSIQTADKDCYDCNGEGEHYDEDCDDYIECGCHTGYGHELRVLVKESELLQIRARLALLFKAIKAEVNDSCGLHVHLDMRHRDPLESAKRLLNAQSLMFKTMPSSRKNNEYCMPVIKRHYPDLMSIGKYHAIHTKHTYSYRKTIEVRLHEGTVDAFEIYNWCKFLVHVVDTDVADKIIRVNNIKKFPVRIKSYLQKRISHV